MRSHWRDNNIIRFGFIMYYTILVLVVLAASVAAEMEECKQLGHPRIMHCCKDRHPPKEGEGDRALLDECFKLHKPPPSCDVDMCIAKKKGFLNEDGSINKKAMTEDLEKDLKTNPELYLKIKTACLDGDVSMYAPLHECEMKKLSSCAHVQMLKACTEWSEEGECKAVKELAEKCRD